MTDILQSQKHRDAYGTLLDHLDVCPPCATGGSCAYGAALRQAERQARTAVPHYLPVSAPLELMTVDDTWSAVAVPSVWGHHVLGVLGDRLVPVFEDPGLRHLVWPVPPSGAEDWPDASAADVVHYDSGDCLLVPCAAGYHDGTRWLRSPLVAPPFADPDVLRAAIEAVIGPLADIPALGPVDVCRHCHTPTRDVRPVDYSPSMSGPGIVSYTCRQCSDRHDDGRHLYVVPEKP